MLSDCLSTKSEGIGSNLEYRWYETVRGLTLLDCFIVYPLFCNHCNYSNFRELMSANTMCVDRFFHGKRIPVFALNFVRCI